jgi:ABC-type uncharacterized transport system substrate-binding protein
VSFVAVGFGADTTAFDAIRDQLRALGQVEGQTFAVDLRVSDDPSQLSKMASDVVRSGPNAIVAINSTVAAALMPLTRTIPIVVVFSGDPILLGLTKDVGRPTGNLTGIDGMQEALIVKRLEVLRSLAPSAVRIGILYDLGVPSHHLALANAQAAASSFAFDLVPLGVARPADVMKALEGGLAGGLDGLIPIASPMTLTQRQTIAKAEKENRLPAVHEFVFEVKEGALAAYGPELNGNFERAAQYVDRLLRGATVAELPFDAPWQFVLAVNLLTARAIGLDIPSDLIARADEIIE